MLLGIGGALVGGFVGRAIGLYRQGQAPGFFMSLLGAVVLVAIYHATTARRRPA
jgi:uncharacterized membrane protein YeaQ/YmgE (transglycosylase-associated protein family)